MDFSDFKNKKLFGLYGGVVSAGLLLVALLNPNSILGLPNGVLGNLGSLSGLFGGGDDDDSEVADADVEADRGDEDQAGESGNGPVFSDGSGATTSTEGGPAGSSGSAPGAPGTPGAIPGQPIPSGGQIPGTPGGGTVPGVAGYPIGPIVTNPGPLPLLPAPLPTLNNPVPGALAPLRPIVRPVIQPVVQPVIRQVPGVSVSDLLR